MLTFNNYSFSIFNCSLFLKLLTFLGYLEEQFCQKKSIENVD